MKKIEKLQNQIVLSGAIKRTKGNMSQIISSANGIQGKEIRWWTSVTTTSYGGDTAQVGDRATTGWGDMNQWNI